MHWRDVDFHPPSRKLREFAAITGVISGAWLIVLERRPAPLSLPAVYFLIAGFLIAALGLVAPRLIRWVYVGLTVATFPLAVVVNFTALAFVYYIVLTPVGWFFRLIGRDALALRRRRNQSHWRPVAARPPASYFRQS